LKKLGIQNDSVSPILNALQNTTEVPAPVKPAPVQSASPVRSKADSNVIHVRSIAEYDTIKKNSGDKLVVVDFSAVWCGPCRMIAPKYAELSKLYEDVVFLHVDIDQLNSLPDANVSGVPTFKFFKKSGLVAEFSGANVAKLEQTVALHK